MSLRTSWALALCAGLGLVWAGDAQADAWCKTRNHCNWLSKRYTANAYVGCIGFTLPLCYQHSGGCGAASASCGWKSCLWGGGTASASNGPGGCSTYKYRTGLGLAGQYIDTAARDDDYGKSNAQSRLEFDETTRSVTVHLEQVALHALSGGLSERLDVYAFVEDLDSGAVNEDDPVRTEANTVWHGALSLKDGVVSADGLEGASLAVATDAAGLSRASTDALSVRLPLAISAEEFERLVVEVRLSEAKVEEPAR